MAVEIQVLRARAAKIAQDLGEENTEWVAHQLAAAHVRHGTDVLIARGQELAVKKLWTPTGLAAVEPIPVRHHNGRDPFLDTIRMRAQA